MCPRTAITRYPRRLAPLRMIQCCRYQRPQLSRSAYCPHSPLSAHRSHRSAHSLTRRGCFPFSMRQLLWPATISFSAYARTSWTDTFSSPFAILALSNTLSFFRNFGPETFFIGAFAPRRKRAAVQRSQCGGSATRGRTAGSSSTAAFW